MIHLRAVSCIAGLLLVPAIASADPPKTVVTLNGVLGAGIGFCTRHELGVGGAGACGEMIAVGAELTVLRAPRYLPHAILELGAGGTPRNERQDPQIHAWSGGVYGLARLMLGVHLGSPAFFRLGGGARLASPFDHNYVVGGHVVSEIGFHLGPLGMGLRGTIGQEPMYTIAGTGFSGNAFVYETLLFLRVRVGSLEFP